MNNAGTRFVALILTLVLLTALFGGCGGSSSDVDEGLKGLGLKDMKNLKEVTLTFYLPGEEKPDAKKVLGEIEKELKSTLNVRLDFKWLPYRDLRSEIRTLIDSNDNFEGFYFYPSEYMEELNSGKLKDITRLLPEYAPSLYKSFSEQDIEASKIGGRLVVVPKSIRPPEIEAVTVREDLRKKYNVPEIKTLEDYGVYMGAVKNGEKGMAPGSAISYGSMDLLARAYDYVPIDESSMLVYKKNDPDMKLIPWENVPEFKNFVNLVSGWREKGYIGSMDEEEYYNDNLYDKIVKDMTGGKLASIVNGYGFSRTLNAEVKTSGHSNWEFKDYILYPDKNFQKPQPFDGAIALNANGANVQRALMFLNWIQSSSENYALFMYGIKDRKYIFDENGVKPFTPGSKIGSYAGWQGSDAFWSYNYEMEGYAPTDEIGKTQMETLGKMEYPPHLGFTPDYSQIMEDIEGRQSEFGSDIGRPLSTGELNSESLAAAQEYLKEMGTDKIVMELQNQLDKWRSRNKK